MRVPPVERAVIRDERFWGMPWCTLMLLLHSASSGHDSDSTLPESTTDTSSTILLESRLSIALPPDERIRGVVGDKHGRVLSWNRTRVWLTLQGRPPIKLCPSSSSEIDGAFFAEPSATIGMINARAGVVLRQEPLSLSCSIWFRFPQLLGTLADASWIGGHLLLLVLKPFHSLELLIVDSLGHVQTSAPIRFPPGETTPLEWSYLSRTDRGVIVGSHRMPAWWILLDRKGAELLTSNGVAASRLAPLRIEALRDVYAGPVIRLGDAFVQTFTNLTSQQRILVLYDATGEFTRLGAKATQVSLVGTLPGDSLAIGLKREPREMMLYARTRSHTIPRR